ncbi:hypothetical protein BCR44DRAFT_56199 [Catenaria anguillulae PL171]|uniref:Uncharacterized protein n=1 Tax=Catenaria anguillulae PL171 TaxID=765915 RepID=A0A1Y2I4D5_9FUNG|nr:hypothetical protein BCR44DRAFT_56199 [Catenaria anguillulae PL171]
MSSPLLQVNHSTLGPTPSTNLPASAPSQTQSSPLTSSRDRDRYASTGGDHDDHNQHHDHSHLSPGHGALQPRPILKSERNLSRSSAHLRWDEDTIKLHDAERGTRMKIDEPKTPWTRADHSLEHVNTLGADGGGIPPLDLLDAMDVDPSDMVPSVVKDRETEAAKTNDDWSDDEDEEDHLDEEAAEHKRQFEKMRSQHYNMKEALQRAKWLAEHEDAQDEDDEDEDDEPEIKIRVPPVPPLPSSLQKH